MTLGVNVSIRLVPVNEIINLRHAVLRQGLPRESAIFEEDQTAGTIHLGAFVKDSLIGCVTLHPSQWKAEPAWQLRGMACRADWQNRGIGRRLIESAERRLLNGNGPRLLWCNARVPAVGFYQKLGWVVMSEEFEVPIAGPHMKMVKRLEEAADPVGDFP